MRRAEVSVITLLKSLGFNALAEIPTKLQSIVDDEEFVTVQRSGGPNVLSIDKPLMIIQSWAADFDKAEDLSARVDDALLSFAPPSPTGITHIDRNTLYRFPHQLIRCGRYQGVYNVVIN